MILKKYLKMNILFDYICPITFEPLKMGGLCIKMVVIPKDFVIFLFNPLN